MTRRSNDDLRLGAAVVELLIPHRRPFLMVDGVERFRREEPVRIEAYRHVSMSEPCFAGHFPEMPLWPGALTMEGLGQTSALLLALKTLCDLARQDGEDPDRALGWLRNLDRGYRMHPGYRPESLPPLLDRLGARGGTIGIGAAVQMKFLRPVLPGCQICYAVEITADLGDRIRFSAEAVVEGVSVAKGTITGAVVSAPDVASGL
ncbi:MAG: hypothetical protein HKN73_08025 [Gemmatimonadetes bacterium]|nr:hypothetical protein [Gemmatimonadota bacterium]